VLGINFEKYTQDVGGLAKEPIKDIWMLRVMSLFI